VSERSDLNDKVLCDRVIVVKVPLFQAILSEVRGNSSGDAKII
jgi:hypothetical protein